MGTSCLTIEKVPIIEQEPRNTKTTSNQEVERPQQAPLPRERLSPGAHTGPVDFALRALVAQKLLHLRKTRCCRAAEKPAIRADCSKDQRWNSETVDFPVIGSDFSNDMVCLWMPLSLGKRGTAYWPQ